MVKNIDDVISTAPPTARALMALGSLGMTAFALGVVIGSWGIRNDVDNLSAVVEADRQARIQGDATNAADLATNRNEVSSLRRIIEEVDLRGIAARVTRIDIEFCLMRADAGGSISRQAQNECAARGTPGR